MFGAPITPDVGEDARRFGARVEAAVATLSDEVATDWWSARQRSAAGTTPSPRGPEAGPWRRSWALGPVPGAARPEAGERLWPKV
jgi:hypothetical protein